MYPLRSLHLALLTILVCSPYGVDAQKAKRPLQRSPAPPIRRALNAKEVFDRWKSCVYTIKTDKAQGTGFAYLGTLMTCYHVVDGATSVTASLPGKRPIPLNRFVHADKEADVAMLVASRSLASSVNSPAKPKLNVGDPVYVIGSPEGLEHTLTEGILSARRTENGIDYLQLSASISPGSSGSPVFNKYGDLVGMVVSTIHDGQQLNFAVSIDTITARPFGVPIDSGLEEQNTRLSDWLIKAMRESNMMNVKEAPDFQIMVGLSDALKQYVSEEDVTRWAKEELSHSAPEAHVISKEQANAKWITPSSSFDFINLMQRLDQASRILNITITFIDSSTDGFNFYSVQVAFTRNCVHFGGMSPYANTWDKLIIGHYGSNYNTDDQLRDSVVSLVKEFADDWSRDNK